LKHLYRYLILASLCIPLRFYGQSIDFTISGILRGAAIPKSIYLFYSSTYDSIEIQANKTFVYKGKLDNPDLVTISATNKNPCYLYINEAGIVNVELAQEIESGPNTNSLKDLKIVALKGPSETEAYQKLMTTKDSLLTKYPPQDFPATDSFSLTFYPFVKDFIAEHPKSYISAELARFYRFSLDNKKKLFSLLQENPNKEKVGLLHTEIARMELLKKGNKIRDFSLNTIQGKTIQFRSIKNKFILIQFWASWCAPCRVEAPQLIQLYSKYHSKGLDIVSISLDDNKSDWAQAIKKDKISWLNASDLKGWKGPLAKMFRIDYVPFYILLDSSYSVITTDVWPDQFSKVLAYYTSR
jgi:thiol-disulfide isomerase/thioredoxin